MRAAGTTLTLRPARSRDVLLGAVAALSVLTLAARIVAREWSGSTAANGLRFFDATREGSLPNFFSALLLLACAALALALARSLHRRRWLLLAGALGALALDEAVAFHESTVRPLRHALDAGGVLYFTWVLPGALFVAVAVVVFRPLLGDLAPARRRLAVAAVAIFFVGALGFELAEGWVVDRHGRDALASIPLETVEETLEMVGATLFLYVLAARLEPWAGTLRLGHSSTDGLSNRHRRGAVANDVAQAVQRQVRHGRGDRADPVRDEAE